VRSFGSRVGAREKAAWRGGAAAERVSAHPETVLFDRDGTLVVDVPYNGDPEAVVAVPGARAALDRLRAAGCRLAIVSNQSGIARGLLDRAQVDAVNRRVEALLGPFDAVLVCPHDEGAACACRKPQPGLLLDALRRLGGDPRRAVMIGDIGADVAAGGGAGTRTILVPTAVTRAEEVAEAPEVARSLGEAVDRLLGGDHEVIR
jgi:HAD superfamily hydrolase (TIGR01662 family)